jgi:excisionase family DNA binding protein
MKGTERKLMRLLADGELSVEQQDAMLRAAHAEKTNDHEGPALLTQAQAARILGVCRHTVRNLVLDGELPTVRLRGAVRYPRSAVQALAEGRATR